MEVGILHIQLTEPQRLRLSVLLEENPRLLMTNTIDIGKELDKQVDRKCLQETPNRV